VTLIQVVEKQSGDVAQLVRALPCHGRGRGFEPRRPRHKPIKINGLWQVIFIEITPQSPSFGNNPANPL